MYEEAIQTVMTVRDFTQVFDSYAQFEESMIAAKMETNSEMGREEDGKSSLAKRKQMLLLLFNLDLGEQVTQSSKAFRLSPIRTSQVVWSYNPPSFHHPSLLATLARADGS